MTAPRPTDIRVQQVSIRFTDHEYRTPLKFGGVPVNRVTLLDVHCQVRTAAGATAAGFGSMPLGNVWSFPSRVLSYDQTLAAMKRLAERLAKAVNDYQEWGHPLDVAHAMEPEYFKIGAEVTAELGLSEPIPPLCTLVTASPFDAAVHDAYGKVHGLNCYRTYGPEFVSRDLGHYLGPEFAGEWLPQYLLAAPKRRLPLYHLIGALDALNPYDTMVLIGDGLPETLPEWIVYNGLTHLKVKLNGDDLRWDVERVAEVEHAAAPVQHKRGTERWYYSLDFNERCPNVQYLLEFLSKLRELSPAAFARIQYVEQPTSRDLKGSRSNTMHEASRLIPVVIDEALLGLDSLKLAREMGYTGAALKACKGQSQSLLMAAAAQKYGMFLCVQDLTCPGASLIHSASLAAHVPGVAAIEANARQFCPAANGPWAERFPGIFKVTDGTVETGVLTGPGIGATAEHAPAAS